MKREGFKRIYRKILQDVILFGVAYVVSPYRLAALALETFAV